MPIVSKKTRNKRCKACRKLFLPANSLNVVCSYSCAIDFARTEEGERSHRRVLRAERREDKKKIKTRSQLASDAQSAFNSYIRERDRGMPCCSCDKPDDGSHQRHASHYRSVKAASCLRFNTRNVHTSCAQCNSSKSGNLIEYRMRLKFRFGEGYVDWLECQNHTIRYSNDYLIRIRRIFSKKEKMMKNRRNSFNMGNGR